MRCYCAPMEGVTGCRYRQTHSRFFTGVDKYYTPFLSPSQHHVFTRREKREINPERNRGMDVVPQLLTKNAGDFLWAANELFAMGYREVNLNLGCPSGTVVAKGKGSGFLRDLEGLERFLDQVYAGAEGPVSVKTRLGMEDPEEFWPLLELYNRYPICELTVHLRVRSDYYRRPARREGLGRILRESRNIVCCNGDVNGPADLAALKGEHPAVERVMLGRGLIADPGLAARLKGGPATERGVLKDFHDALYRGYAQDFGSDRNAMLRMKEVWCYLEGLFDGGERIWKKLRRTGDPREYEDLVERVFGELALRSQAVPCWQVTP